MKPFMIDLKKPHHKLLYRIITHYGPTQPTPADMSICEFTTNIIRGLFIIAGITSIIAVCLLPIPLCGAWLLASINGLNPVVPHDEFGMLCVFLVAYTYLGGSMCYSWYKKIRDKVEGQYIRAAWKAELGEDYVLKLTKFEVLLNKWIFHFDSKIDEQPTIEIEIDASPKPGIFRVMYDSIVKKICVPVVFINR